MDGWMEGRKEGRREGMVGIRIKINFYFVLLLLF